MEVTDKTVSIYFDQASWLDEVEVDDFIITIGAKQSNSVYHVAHVVKKPRADIRMIRYHLKCYRSDLLTALRRDQTQRIFPMQWYKR
jgi:hypothetical protein